MKPLSEIMLLLRSTTAQSFADRHPNQDVILVEPYEKGRDYSANSELHPGALIRFMPRAQGKPVPIGRDARAQILLDHPAISRLHLVLAYTANEGWKVMDRSSNGSYLDGERMPREQAVPLKFGVTVRLGRAMVLRLFDLPGFHSYARSKTPGGGGAPVAPAPPARPQAETWRLPAVQPAPPAPSAAPAGMQFEFSEPLPGPPAAPTMRFRRGPQQPPGFPPAPAAPGPFAAPPQIPAPPLPSAPMPPRPPSLPRPPAPPPRPSPPSPPRKPKKVSDDDIEYEFDFDFDGDGRGGFA